MDWFSPIYITVLRAIIGFALVFFLPGFAWTLIFFAGRHINTLERLVISVGLSIALVTLSVLAMNMLFAVRITELNCVLITITLTVVPIALCFIKRFIRRSKSSDT